MSQGDKPEIRVVEVTKTRRLRWITCSVVAVLLFSCCLLLTTGGAVYYFWPEVSEGIGSFQSPTGDELVRAAEDGASRALEGFDVGKPPTASEVAEEVWGQAPDQPMLTVEDVQSALGELDVELPNAEALAEEMVAMLPEGISMEDVEILIGQWGETLASDVEAIGEALGAKVEEMDLKWSMIISDAWPVLVPSEDEELPDKTEITPTETISGAFTTMETWPLLPPSYLSEGGIPYAGDEINFDIKPNEVEVYTCGPASVAGVKLPGGEHRGSVIVMLPGTEKVEHYKISGVIPGAGWHGAYRFEDYPTSDEWTALAERTAFDLTKEPNCTDGLGCHHLDILVVQPGEKGPVIVKKWTVAKKGLEAEGGAEGAGPMIGRSDDPDGELADATEETSPEMLPLSLGEGETMVVPAGYVIEGDIEVRTKSEWVELYVRDTPRTGLVTVLTKETKIRCPWGCSGAYGLDPEVVKKRLEANGCGISSGCVNVDIVYWPSQ